MSVSGELAKKILDSYTVEDLEKASKEAIIEVGKHLTSMIKIRHITTYGGAGALVSECNKMWLAICRKVEKEAGDKILKEDAFINFVQKNFQELYDAYKLTDLTARVQQEIKLQRRLSGN